MKLFEEFQPVSKNQWLEKVTSDLKGKKDIKDLSIATVGGQIISPFFHKDDIHQSVDIPSPTIAQSLLGVELIVSDEKNANQLILESLEGGASFLFLKIKIDIPDFHILFNGVLLDLIKVIVQFDDQDAIVICKDYIEETYKQQLLDFSIKDQDCYFITSDGPIGDSLQHLLKRGADAITDDKTKAPIYFQLTIGHNYIENICAIQAARLLWANLLEAHGHAHDDVDLIIVCFVSRNVLSSVHYDNMISLTQMAMSAISGGADIIMLPPSDVLSNHEGKEDTRRISRNIYNLMTMEAHMNRVQSPTDGSYLFDKVSADLASGNWKEFIKNHEA